MTTLVTCATGFVSRAFVQALRMEGERLHVLIRDGSMASLFPGEKVFVGDIFDPSCVARAVVGVDTVVHVPPLMCPIVDGQSQLSMYRRTHVESTRLILDRAVRQEVRRFLFVSSAHVTGRNPDKVLCELGGDEPVSPYAQAKLEAEHLILSYSERCGMEAVILRPPGIYGPGDKSIVSLLLRAARRSLWLPFKAVPTLHSLVFVDSLARAGLALLKVAGVASTPRVFIIKDPADYRPSDVYAAACRALGKQVRLFRAPLLLLRVLASVGSRWRHIPKLGRLGPLREFLTPQRYCGHLFRETLPDFAFANLEEAIQITLSRNLYQPLTRDQIGARSD